MIETEYDDMEEVLLFFDVHSLLVSTIAIIVCCVTERDGDDGRTDQPKS